ncbi:uncharacterized protein EDB93DRAFT_1237966 [Suillus bovinus]|uniref:uncharacterized protein n=1 Tax=Suillus bovinus TaxID=48563 RepID=UPI001B8633B7|nr:uncharacterized protein EDB93DRAFT_1237966 [Suillus bovinus]KAG2158743.1 hypothetical protein EDB93DRAFT_1237966 [Suillus bovinus]
MDHTFHLHHHHQGKLTVILVVSLSLNVSVFYLTAPSEDARYSSVPPAHEVDTEFHGTGKNLYHNYHTGLDAQPCDANGLFLVPGTPPLPFTEQLPDDWSPFRNHTEFEMAEFLYSHAQMSVSNINTLLDLWAASLLKHGNMPPFSDHKDLYKTIDNIPIVNNSNVWYRDPREVARNILTNPDYVNDFDYCPFHEYSVSKDEHRYQDFMSGDWAWKQADILATDPDTLGAIFVPIILGSDKTTVSVGTGNNEYYPLYLSIGNLRNNVLLTSIVRNWCPRCLAPHGKLDDDEALCRCEAHREALFEEDTSDVLRHDFGIVGSIVPFTNDFPCADIHQLIAPDILHQIIKGCFKDHLVTWVEKYLHHGRGFKQWTGDDSKALMKIYLPAIEGHVLTDVIRTFHAFLEFCYLVRRNVIMENTISQIEDALRRFHHYHSIFLQLGVVPTFSLPCQHSMKHYPDLIHLFGAPNGLYLSMMENKHIKAVKQPWCWSNRYNALGQMLVTNQTVAVLTIELSIPNIQNLIGCFLFEQLHPHDPRDHATIPLDSFPVYDGKISVVNSTSSRFYAPSDLSGIRGMQREHIQSCPNWRNIARVLCFFSFKYKFILYECAIIHWFDVIGDAPDEDTGMWVVQPSFDVIHIDTIYRAAHLLPLYGVNFIPCAINFSNSLDKFRAFYVNKFTNHHAFEIAF